MASSSSSPSPTLFLSLSLSRLLRMYVREISFYQKAIEIRARERRAGRRELMKSFKVDKARRRKHFLCVCSVVYACRQHYVYRFSLNSSSYPSFIVLTCILGIRKKKKWNEKV
jgi:hypothetical protein